ncbi:MAG: hypothetical protein OEX19_10725, partial [Gammaproteobacteria bacterium]|nr:hypothetical protein [Gammaproteobacteria bacterium]
MQYNNIDNPFSRILLQILIFLSSIYLFSHSAIADEKPTVLFSIFKSDAIALNRDILSKQYHVLPFENVDMPFIHLERGDYWLEATVTGLSTTGVNYLWFGRGMAHRISFYGYRTQNGHYVATKLDQDNTDPINLNGELIFPISESVPGETTYYFHIQSLVDHIMPLDVYSEPWLQNHSSLRLLWHGMSFGIVALLVTLNLFLYKRYRETVYLTYSVYIAAIIMFMFFSSGLGSAMLWKENIEYDFNGYIIFSTIGQFLAIAFSKQFLNIKKFYPQINSLLTIFQIVLLLNSIVAPMTGFKLYAPIANFLALSAIITLILTAWLIWRRGYKPAGLFLLAESFPYLGATIEIVGIRSGSLYSSEFIVQTAIVVGVVCFSFSVSDRTLFNQRLQAICRLRAQSQHPEIPNSLVDNSASLTSDIDKVTIISMGKFEVWKDGCLLELAQRGQPKHVLLLKLLCASASEGMSEHELCNELWPNIDMSYSRHSLKTTLHRLRKLIGKESINVRYSHVSLNLDEV